MSVRSDFISTSVFEILQEGVAAAECLKQDGIDTYPLLGFLLPSLFLRMTGFEEQKLRSICWEVASVDLSYRYKTLQGHVSYGEFSTLDDKKNVYKLLKDKIEEYGGELNLDSKKEDMFQEVKKEIEDVFKESLIAESFPAEYHQCEIFIKSWNTGHFLVGNVLLGGAIECVYDSLYKQRNRCAHNTASYQQDSITFSEMQSMQMLNSNYFTYFAILLLLDKVFIAVFHAFQESFESRV